MIYGVTIFLNEVNFGLKDRSKQVQSRMMEEAFFTSRKAATSFYLFHLEQWKAQKGIFYGKYENRGRAEMYKATVQDGRVINNGITIYKETI